MQAQTNGILPTISPLGHACRLHSSQLVTTLIEAKATIDASAAVSARRRCSMHSAFCALQMHLLAAPAEMGAQSAGLLHEIQLGAISNQDG